jgi:hypothetical protein
MNNSSLKVGASALMAAMMYGVVNNTLETKLSSYSFFATGFLMSLICTIMSGVALIVMRVMGMEITFPLDSSGRSPLLFASTFYFIAGALDVYAYTIGGSAFVISTIFIAIPLTVLLIMATSERGMPGIGQVGPFLLVAIAIIWSMADALAKKP